MRILYRAKKTADYGGDWIISSMIQIYPTGILMGEFDKGIDINHLSPDDLNDNVRWYPVVEHTLCMAIEYNADDDSGTPKVPIFDKDLVEFELFSGAKYRFLVWYIEEGSTFEAVPWGEDALKRGVLDFINLSNDGTINKSTYPVNYTGPYSWSEFVLQLTDPYGFIKSVKVIGNVFDNPEYFKIPEEFKKFNTNDKDNLAAGFYPVIEF